MARVRLTSARGKFSEAKIKRGKNGRFVDKPGSKVKKPRKLTRSAKDVSDTSVVQLAARKARKINQERLRVLAELPKEQRTKLLSAIGSIKRSQPTLGVASDKPANSKGSKKKPKVSEEDKQVIELNKRLAKIGKEQVKKVKADLKAAKNDKDVRKYARRVYNARANGKPEPFNQFTTKQLEGILGKNQPKEKNRADLRKPVPRERLQYNDKGRLDVWQGNDSGKYKGGFKQRIDREFEYKVKVDDEVLTLNKQSMVMVYEGETIKGVPSMNARLRELPPDKLVGDMAINMKYVEAWDTAKVAAPAPRWDVVQMGGQVPDKYKPDKGYQGMELHHINQWAAKDFNSIRDDVDSGKMTLDEAKEQMRGLLRPNPNITSGYEIKVPEQADRAYVVLPAGLHNFSEGKKLYKANHPEGYHPDTGKLQEFGLPDKKKGSEFGESHGRQLHNNIRDGFWSEYRRREVFVIQGELNRRLEKGEITKEQVKELWDAAIDRQEKSIKESRRGTQLS